jgi:flagellar basal body-associated protein FliL
MNKKDITILVSVFSAVVALSGGVLIYVAITSAQAAAPAGSIPKSVGMHPVVTRLKKFRIEL